MLARRKRMSAKIIAAGILIVPAASGRYFFSGCCWSAFLSMISLRM